MTGFGNDEGSLKSAARAIASEDAALGASQDVERRLIAEVGAIRRARRLRAFTFSAAAVVLVAALVVPARGRFTGRARAGRIAPVEAPSAAADARFTEFFPLGFTAVPVTGAQIVRIEVPRSALRSFGLVPIDAPGAAVSPVALADVIVGEDGLARAVRFVSARKIREPGNE